MLHIASIRAGKRRPVGTMCSVGRCRYSPNSRQRVLTHRGVARVAQGLLFGAVALRCQRLHRIEPLSFRNCTTGRWGTSFRLCDRCCDASASAEPIRRPTSVRLSRPWEQRQPQPRPKEGMHVAGASLTCQKWEARCLLLRRLQKSTGLLPRQQQLHTTGDAQAAFQLAEQANKDPWRPMVGNANGSYRLGAGSDAQTGSGEVAERHKRPEPPWRKHFRAEFGPGMNVSMQQAGSPPARPGCWRWR